MIRIIYDRALYPKPYRVDSYPQDNGAIVEAFALNDKHAESLVDALNQGAYYTSVVLFKFAVIRRDDGTLSTGPMHGIPDGVDPTNVVALFTHPDSAHEYVEADTRRRVARDARDAISKILYELDDETRDKVIESLRGDNENDD